MCIHNSIEALDEFLYARSICSGLGLELLLPFNFSASIFMNMCCTKSAVVFVLEPNGDDIFRVTWIVMRFVRV